MKSSLRRFIPAVIILLGCLAFYGGCVSKKTADREQQQYLVRSLEDQCRSGVSQACERIESEKILLRQIYGCHCTQRIPVDHKPVW